MTDLAAILDAEIVFERRGDPIPADLRPIRRVSLLLLALSKHRATGGSWKSLQVVSWALRNERNMAVFREALNRHAAPTRPIVRIDPAVDRAIDLAVGLGLVTRADSGAYKLTDAGSATVRELEQSEVLAVERAALEQIDGKLTMRSIDQLLEWRTQ